MTTKRTIDQVPTSGRHLAKRCKPQDAEPFSIIPATTATTTSNIPNTLPLDLASCFPPSMADIPASHIISSSPSSIPYDFAEFANTPHSNGHHLGDFQDALSYPFFEFLGTGASAPLSVPHTSSSPFLAAANCAAVETANATATAAAAEPTQFDAGCSVVASPSSLGSCGGAPFNTHLLPTTTTATSLSILPSRLSASCFSVPLSDHDPAATATAAMRTSEFGLSSHITEGGIPFHIGLMNTATTTATTTTTDAKSSKGASNVAAANRSNNVSSSNMKGNSDQNNTNNNNVIANRCPQQNNAVSNKVNSEQRQQSDGPGSASTGADDSESSRRQADRAARNRESSRRAREKAKTRLKSLEQEVVMLREHCRRYKLQMDALAQQAARGQCGMCGCVTGPPTSGIRGAVPHGQMSHNSPVFLQAPQDQAPGLVSSSHGR